MEKFSGKSNILFLHFLEYNLDLGFRHKVAINYQVTVKFKGSTKFIF